MEPIPSLEALRSRYREQRERGLVADACRTLAEVIAAFPGEDWAHAALARLLRENGRRDEAERVARAALARSPDSASAHDTFGTLLSEKNELAAGEWHFRRALELGGPRAPVLANLGLNLMQQGRLGEAEAAYREAEALAPGDVRVLAQWAKLAEVAGEVPRASELLDRASAATSESEVNLLRARLHIRSGEHARALELLDGCREMNGD